MPPVLSVLSVIGLLALGCGVVAQFWSNVTKGLAQDEMSVYGESLRSVCPER